MTVRESYNFGVDMKAKRLYTETTNQGETMIKKRFTDVNISYEESWIRLKDNGLFLIFPIHYTDKEEYGLPTLEDLLNELNDENEQLKEEIQSINKDLTQIMLILLDDDIVSKLTKIELKAFERLSKFKGDV